MNRLQILKPKYFNDYHALQPITLLKHFNKIKVLQQTTENFEFYASGSAVFSSMIEGNKIDFDTYLKFKHSGMNNKGKSFNEIEDLIKAYHFAKNHQVSYTNLMVVHTTCKKPDRR
jgi:hypothetical protein